MKMQVCNRQMKCDFEGCKNFGKYSFSTKGFVRHEIVFCEKCMKEMFDCFSKQLVPKAIDAPFKRRKNKRRDYEN